MASTSNKKDRTVLIQPGVARPAPANGPVAFLIEKSSRKHYQVIPGRHTVGRLSSSKKSDIGVDTDDLKMSGCHCILEARLNRNNQHELLISDNESKNGVLVNKVKKLNPGEVILLADMDTFTLGRTEFIVLTRRTIGAEEELTVWIENNLR